MLASIAVTPANASIAAGTVQQFTATGTYSDGSSQDLTGTASWSSSETSVATINGTGMASGVGAGSTIIQATSSSVSGSTGLTVTAASSPISVAVTPATASVQAPSGTQQFTATVTNDSQNGGVTWSLSGSGCSGVSCGALSAGSSTSGEAITYTAPAAAPTPATVALTATSVSDTTRASSATISINPSGTPTGSTFVESFGESSDLCWNGGPSSCDQVWVVARGSGQSIVASPGIGSSSAANVNISLNAWHTVRLHLASGTNASYIAVNGGAQNAFTENALDYQYLVVGASAGQLDAMTHYIGNVHIDSELGGGPPPSMYIDFESATDGAPVRGSLSQTLNSVTDTQGNTYTIVANPTSGTYGRAAMAYAIARSSAPATVSCNFSTASMGKSIIVHEIRGVDTSRPLDGHTMNVRLSPGSGANAVTSTNITTTVNGDYLVGFTFNDSGNRATWAAGTGYALRQNLQIASYTMASEDRIQASAGPAAATFTATAAGFGDFITGILAFQPWPEPMATLGPDADTYSSALSVGMSDTSTGAAGFCVGWTRPAFTSVGMSDTSTGAAMR